MTDFREDVQQLTHHLLGSQAEYLFSPEKEKVLAAGFRAGKTRIGCLGATLLSYYIPDNLGFIGRASGKDLKETTLQTFEEVCPPSLFAARPKGYGQQGKIYYIKSRDPNRPSKIICDYVVDKQSGKFHAAGGNWGFFLLDQGEEVAHKDYLKLLSRLSRGKKTFALSNINQQGHDWWFNEFYAKGDYKFDILREPSLYWKAIRGNNRLAIISRSEENRESYGGFVPDDYFDTLRRTYPPAWCARYLDGSFDDFSGKIWSDYSSTSVHNIQPFDIPSYWPWIVSIDVGGSAPWSVGIYRSDPYGNVIRTKGFYKGNCGNTPVIQWLQANLPRIESTRFIIDYENRASMIEIGDRLGVIMEPARKDVLAGIHKTQSWFFVVEGTPLPDWYKATQPAESWQKFSRHGSPRIFVFDDGENQDFQRSNANYIWDERKLNVPKEDDNEHCADEIRYLVMSDPRPAESERLDPFAHLQSDPASYDSARHMERIIQRAKRAYDPDADGDLGNGGTARFIEEMV